MKILLELHPDEPGDVDPDDDTGLTVAAYDRLVNSVIAAGFSIGDVRGETEL